MAKYHFHKMGSEKFQTMAQSLLETKRRDTGNLIQFGAVGADGAREATWTQTPNHPDYVRPESCTSDVAKEWVFQVKFHDIGLRGWDGAGAAVLTDLKAELEKITSKYQIPCHHYILITNVPLTGARRIGTKDKISKIAKDWKSKIPEIEVWDAADLSRMLDNNVDVRTGYADLILPGDVLSALYRQLQLPADRIENVFRGYLHYLLANESKARADEAGDDDALPLTKVFVDQTLKLDQKLIPECYYELVQGWVSDSHDGETTKSFIPDNLDCVSSSFPLLWGAQEKIMLLAGPGYGKSTITQFLALYHASRVIKPDYAAILALRFKLPENWTPVDLDASCEIRFPFRVELRRYAKWRGAQPVESLQVGIASYIARQLIGGAVESSLDQNDIFTLIASNPTLLILDGLDEVPNKEDRDEILKDCDAFLYRCTGENVNLQIVMSSRPQGYHGEFDRFQPLRWGINDLSLGDFTTYSDSWLAERIKGLEERTEAKERINRGMTSDAVRRLATTLLQATVMLTIVRRKSDIPEERHKLFERYVDVVFEREKAKSDLIAQYERELRLLHEMVGYQIHEAIGRREAGNVPEGKFKDLVCKVWCLLRGDDPFPGILNQEIQKIFDLAKDRLVFLSGKGSNQTDIDFVIQPYREYFAAKYLSNHAEAVPDLVFECLVERGAYWQNVLRFYAAMASPAQQVSWAYGAASQPAGEPTMNDLVAGIRSRRGTILTLPEFGLFQLQQFRRTIAGAMPKSEWWTWLGQEWAVPIICGLRSGGVWRELWKDYTKEKSPKPSETVFALWVFPRAIDRSAPEFPDFVNFIRSLLANPIFGESAALIALGGNLPIDFSENSEEILLKAVHEFPTLRQPRGESTLVNLVKRLPRNAAIRFLCTVAYRLPDFNPQEILWSYLGLPIKVNEQESAVVDGGGASLLFIVVPYWLRPVISGQVSLPLRDRMDVPGSYEEYVLALYAALESPEDAFLHRRAELLMKNLPEQPIGFFSCNNFLGPSPNEFNSIEDWSEYRAGVRRFFGAVEDLRSLSTTASSLQDAKPNQMFDWTTLLFPPKQWRELVLAELLSEQAVEALRKEEWARLASLPKDAIEFSAVTPYDVRVDSAVTIPFFKLMSIAVRLHNQGTLYDSDSASSILRLVNPWSVTATEVHTLITTVREPAKFPDGWATALIEIAVRMDGIDLEVLARFWNDLREENSRRIWFEVTGSCDAKMLDRKVSQLLMLEGDCGLDLALAIARQRHDPRAENWLKMNRRAAFRLRQKELRTVKTGSLLSCLLASRQTIEEAELYADSEAFDFIAKEVPGFFKQVASRLSGMPQTLSREEFPRLKCALEAVLEKRSIYPFEFSAAALDGLIQIDIANRAALSESDWMSA